MSPEIVPWMVQTWEGWNGSGVMGTATLTGLVLGLRHATDADHLAAVSTLVLSDDRAGARRSGALGGAWGAGHAVTLLGMGLPVILLGSRLPGAVQRGAEVLVGLLIAALAVQLLHGWRRGEFHGSRSTGSSRIRSPLTAFGIGLVHGVGGSALVGVVVAAAAGEGPALLALCLFAGATAASMALVTFVLGHALLREPFARSLPWIVPPAAVLTLAFGIWYALEPLTGGGVPH